MVTLRSGDQAIPISNPNGSKHFFFFFFFFYELRHRLLHDKCDFNLYIPKYMHICAPKTIMKPEDQWSCKRSPDILAYISKAQNI